MGKPRPSHADPTFQSSAVTCPSKGHAPSWTAAAARPADHAPSPNAPLAVPRSHAPFPTVSLVTVFLPRSLAHRRGRGSLCSACGSMDGGGRLRSSSGFARPPPPGAPNARMMAVVWRRRLAAFPCGCSSAFRSASLRVGFLAPLFSGLPTSLRSPAKWRCRSRYVLSMRRHPLAHAPAPRGGGSRNRYAQRRRTTGKAGQGG